VESSQSAGASEIRRGDRATVTAAVEVLSGRSRRKGLGRVWPFLGPAFVASVAYVDPGNFATNLQGGAQYGYLLLWVVIASNLMAMLVQTLSAKLGIATGRNLAELCRERYPRWLVWTMWALMEVVAMDTDLAEFLGAAIGFNLLLGVPMLWAGLMTAAVTFAILALERYGFRPLEAVITALVGVIAFSYLVELGIAGPDWAQAARHAVIPQFAGKDSVKLAVGILGATVMPHVIFLHSALTQGRIIPTHPSQLKRLFRYELLDVVIAMGVAGAINAAMLIMAAKTFYDNGQTDVDAIEKGYKTLEGILGSSASFLFALSLLASGLSSSAVGTMAGQVIMQGFLRRHIPIWIRRLVTMAPALAVIAAGLNAMQTLVWTQVILSLLLPLAIIPLVQFTCRRDIMGPLVNRRFTTALSFLVAALILYLNGYMLWDMFFGKKG
jgi:manganese transport protein